MLDLLKAVTLALRNCEQGFHPRRAVLSALPLALLLLSLCSATSPCWADLAVHGRLVTHSGTIVDTLTSTMQFKGPQLRRSLEGKGTLADFLGHRVELADRANGETVILDLETLTFDRNNRGLTLCHPWLAFDLRWLGRTQGGVQGELSLPETTSTRMGVTVFPVDLRFPARVAGGSTIRFWVTRELDSLVGEEGVRALYCELPSAQAGVKLAELLAGQFGLSPEAEKQLREVVTSFPVSIENFLGQGPSRMELSRFETLSVSRAPLADSLFAIPKTYRPAETQE